MSGKPYAFSEQQTNRIIHLYEEMQLSVEKIAERFETNCMSVWRALKRHGVKIRPNSRQSKVDMDKVVSMYRSGSSANDIADHYGLKGESIRYRLIKAGIIMRSKSVAAAMAIGSEWTPERVSMLRELWALGLPCAEIKEKLGISYHIKSIQQKARNLGLVRESKSPSEIALHASAVTAAREYQQDTLISFLPDSPQLESDWRSILSDVRKERAQASQARWGF